jgi:hypothetical protein
MFRRIGGVLLALIFAIAVSGACAQDEHEVTNKTEEQTESTPTDTSPGEMTVE